MPTASPITQKHNPYWAWIWFAYTGFLFIDPIFEPTLFRWSVTFASFAVFACIYALYVRAFDNHSPLRFWMIAATFVLGLIIFPVNEGAMTFFIYAAAFVPFNILSLRRIFVLFLLEVLLVLADGYLFHAHAGLLHTDWPNTLIGIFLMGMIGGGNIFFALQGRANCQLRAAQEENLALAAVAERERIARDLHDVLGHTLSVIVLKAELASRLLTSTLPAPDPHRAAAEIADVERIARTALAEVREAIGGYRARGLAAEIEAARLTLDAAGVTLILDSASASVALLPDDASGAPGPTSGTWDSTTGRNTAALTVQEETALALALREAVTNIVRHARATTCSLRFLTEDHHRRLVIEDNGVSPSGPSALIREGNGLRGMRQRIESIGGHLSLQHDSGTRLQIDLPLREPAAS
jgi:two-component system sensor histidine kinase DesK